MLYFAYGPDMSSNWMAHVVPTAKPVSRGWLGQHRLYFHKVGADGSGKCDAFFTANDRDNILGVLYEVDSAQNKAVGKAEEFADGYMKKVVSVINDEGKKLEAFTYCAGNIETNLREDIPPIKADPGQIEQILINLIVNARDAINEKTDKAADKKIVVETGYMFLDEEFVEKHSGSNSGPHVVLTVRDTGIGMDVNVREKIFEPFFTTKDKDWELA